MISAIHDLGLGIMAHRKQNKRSRVNDSQRSVSRTALCMGNLHHGHRWTGNPVGTEVWRQGCVNTTNKDSSSLYFNSELHTTAGNLHLSASFSVITGNNKAQRRMHKAILIWKEKPTVPMHKADTVKEVEKVIIKGTSGRQAGRRMHKALLIQSNEQLATTIDSQGCLREGSGCRVVIKFTQFTGNYTCTGRW